MTKPSRVMSNCGDLVGNESDSDENNTNQEYDDLITLPVCSYNDLMQILHPNLVEINFNLPSFGKLFCIASSKKTYFRAQSKLN